MISDLEMCIGLHERLVVLEEEREVCYAALRRRQLLDTRMCRLADLLDFISPRPWMPRTDEAKPWAGPLTPPEEQP